MDNPGTHAAGRPLDGLRQPPLTIKKYDFFQSMVASESLQFSAGKINATGSVDLDRTRVLRPT